MAVLRDQRWRDRTPLDTAEVRDDRGGRPRSQSRCPVAFARRSSMATRRVLLFCTTLIVLVLSLLTGEPRTGSQDAVSIDADDIGGVVTGKHGPEASVWVIAETSELGTLFAKMVVTDDRGRYVIPDLPAATYRIWVRGY